MFRLSKFTRNLKVLKILWAFHPVTKRLHNSLFICFIIFHFRLAIGKHRTETKNKKSDVIFYRDPMKKLYMPGQSFVDSLGHIGYPIQVHHTVFSAKACCRCSCWRRCSRTRLWVRTTKSRRKKIIKNSGVSFLGWAFVSKKHTFFCLITSVW